MILDRQDIDIPALTVPELVELYEGTIEEIKADNEKYDERVALQAEKLNDGKTTGQRAIEALQRPERFKGEHDVARRWLREYEPPIRIFSRVTK